jgi:hypothetical protein
MAFNLKDLFDEYDFDFIGLQETMKKKVDVPVCREFDPNNKYTWIWSPSVRTWRDLMWNQILKI